MARLKFTSDPETAKKIRAMEHPMAAAVTGAVRDAANIALREGRANIASAGFGPRWENSLNVRMFPQSRNSLKAKALIFTQINYAGVFEKGVMVRGNPLLWLPLPTVPKGPGGRAMTPRQFGKLVSVNRPGHRPLLIGKPPGSDKSVPLFFGVESVRIPKKLRIIEIVNAAADKLPQLFLDNLKADE